MVGWGFGGVVGGRLIGLGGGGVRCLRLGMVDQCWGGEDRCGDEGVREISCRCTASTSLRVGGEETCWCGPIWKGGCRGAMGDAMVVDATGHSTGHTCSDGVQEWTGFSPPVS